MKLLLLLMILISSTIKAQPTIHKIKQNATNTTVVVLEGGVYLTHIELEKTKSLKVGDTVIFIPRRKIIGKENSYISVRNILYKLKE